MYHSSIDLALDRSQASTALSRLVLTLLARLANKNYQAWPSQTTLARRAGVSDRSIRNALHMLEELGEITVVKSGQGRSSTVYRVVVLEPDYPADGLAGK